MEASGKRGDVRPDNIQQLTDLMDSLLTVIGNAEQPKEECIEDLSKKVLHLVEAQSKLMNAIMKRGWCPEAVLTANTIRSVEKATQAINNLTQNVLR